MTLPSIHQLYPFYNFTSCNPNEQDSPVSEEKKNLDDQKSYEQKYNLIDFFACLKCGIDQTPQRRNGPMGKRTLCNACGLQYATALKENKRNPDSTSLANWLYAYANSKKGAILQQNFIHSCKQCTTPIASEWRTGPNGKDTFCKVCALQQVKAMQATTINNLSNQSYKMAIGYILN